MKIIKQEVWEDFSDQAWEKATVEVDHPIWHKVSSTLTRPIAITVRDQILFKVYY